MAHLCDACRHDLEALDEQVREAERQAAHWFATALRKRQQFADKLDEAATCSTPATSDA